MISQVDEILGACVEGERLSDEAADALFRSGDLLSLGAAADSFWKNKEYYTVNHPWYYGCGV